MSVLRSGYSGESRSMLWLLKSWLLELSGHSGEYTCFIFHEGDHQSPMPPQRNEMIENTIGRDELTHWGRVTHKCVDNLTILGSDNCLSPGRSQAIILINVGILLIGPLGTNFSEILIEIHTFSFKKLHLKTSSAKWRPFVSASMC